MRCILKNLNLFFLFVASGLFFFNEMLLMPTLPLYLLSNSFVYLLCVRFFHGTGITFFLN